MLLIFLRLQLASDEVAVVLRVAAQCRFKLGVLQGAVVSVERPLQITAFCQSIAPIVLRVGIGEWIEPLGGGGLLPRLKLCISLAARVREKLRGTLRVARLKGMLTLLIAAIPKIRPGACLCAPGEQYPDDNAPRDFHSQPRRAIRATDTSNIGSSHIPSLRQL